MRISDWSSDVCSSDLGDNVAYVLVGAEPGVEPDRLARRIQTAVTGTTAQTRGEFARQEASVVRDMVADVMLIMTEIGRASCRARVCQYVKTSVVAVSLKQKNIKI